MGRAGTKVRGRSIRSGRHHSRSGRNRPRGVAPSPSRLLALMPARPSATGTTNGPACSKPCDRRPGRARTAISRRNILRIRFTHPGKQIPNCRLPLYPCDVLLRASVAVQSSFRQLVMRTSEPKPHLFNRLLVSPLIPKFAHGIADWSCELRNWDTRHAANRSRSRFAPIGTASVTVKAAGVLVDAEHS